MTSFACDKMDIILNVATISGILKLPNSGTYRPTKDSVRMDPVKMLPCQDVDSLLIIMVYAMEIGSKRGQGWA